jgi:hypothetical protein
MRYRLLSDLSNLAKVPGTGPTNPHTVLCVLEDHAQRQMAWH